MNRSVLCAVVVGLGTIVLSSARAAAQDEASVDADSEAIIEGIERDEQAFEAALGQQPDCEVACRAFESMRRSAERLCELESGDRCAAARSRVEDAASRLRESCPECEAVRRELQAHEGGVDHDVPEEAPASAPEPASAPPTESRRGTCAACTIGGDAHEDDERAGFFALFALAAAAYGRRRRGRRRRSERSYDG